MIIFQKNLAVWRNQRGWLRGGGLLNSVQSSLWFFGVVLSVSQPAPAEGDSSRGPGKSGETKKMSPKLIIFGLNWVHKNKLEISSSRNVRIVPRILLDTLKPSKNLRSN